MGKHQRRPHPKRAAPRDTKPGEMLHMDVCGPMEENLYGGARYFASFIDDASRYAEVRLFKRKTEVTEACKDVFELIKTQTGRKLKTIQTDNRREYLNKEMEACVKAKRIRHIPTAPYNPAHNRVAERFNQTIMEERAQRLAAKLPKKAWGESVKTAAYVRNMSSVAQYTKTPWELFFGQKPDVSGLRVFGSTAYVQVPGSDAQAGRSQRRDDLWAIKARHTECCNPATRLRSAETSF
jgi:transposase InsO family protein